MENWHQKKFFKYGPLIGSITRTSICTNKYLHDKLVFSLFIGIICLRPDIILFSTSIETVIIGINLLLQQKYEGMAPKQILYIRPFG